MLFCAYRARFVYLLLCVYSSIAGCSGTVDMFSLRRVSVPILFLSM